MAVKTVGVALVTHAVPLSWRGAVALPLVGVLVTAICGWRFRARVGGLTGDFLGATQQVGECALLLTIVLIHG